jgi:hypothetical protein
MQSSNSTTTTTGQPILTNNLDYSSNWYLYSLSQNTVNYYSNYLTTEPSLRNFDPNQLLLPFTITTPNGTYTYQLRKGFIKTPNTHNNFQLYNDFTTTSYSEAALGWYRPLIDWISNDSFYYGTNNRTIFVNVKENCDFMNNTTSSRSAYIIFTNSQGATIPTDVDLTISVSIYDTNGGLISLFYANVPSNSVSVLLPFYISISSNVGSIIINNIQLNGSSTSNYIIGTCQACITKICNQTWMTHNLAVKKYRNGDVISQVTDPTIWTGLTTGAWCYYNNNPSTEAEYGILYNHYAVTDPRVLAPTGYHIPTRAEFTT